jgi:hypothetical protein
MTRVFVAWVAGLLVVAAAASAHARGDEGHVHTTATVQVLDDKVPIEDVIVRMRAEHLAPPLHQHERLPAPPPAKAERTPGPEPKPQPAGTRRASRERNGNPDQTERPRPRRR